MWELMAIEHALRTERITTEDAADLVLEMAEIEAAELIGPNAVGYDALVEKLCEKYLVAMESMK